jgi:hypothetical protein
MQLQQQQLQSILSSWPRGLLTRGRALKHWHQRSWRFVCVRPPSSPPPPFGVGSVHGIFALTLAAPAAGVPLPLLHTHHHQSPLPALHAPCQLRLLPPLNQNLPPCYGTRLLMTGLELVILHQREVSTSLCQQTHRSTRPARTPPPPCSSAVVGPGCCVPPFRAPLRPHPHFPPNTQAHDSRLMTSQT